MTWFGDLFASHAKKNKMRRKGGMHNRRPMHYKDPEKYKGGKGSLQRRREVVTGPNTKRTFQDNRANSAEPPVYKKVSKYKRSNPRSTDWSLMSEPKYIIISEPVFKNELSDEAVRIIREANNECIIKRGEDGDRRYEKTVLFGNGLQKVVTEYRLQDDPDLETF